MKSAEQSGEVKKKLGGNKNGREGLTNVRKPETDQKDARALKKADYETVTTWRE